MLRRISMWSGPRNISTTMMRSFESRGDTYVSDEPMYGHFLNNTNIKHPFKEEIILSMETNRNKLREYLCNYNPEGFVIWYQKQMSHHILDDDNLNWIGKFDNIFLIRHPKNVYGKQKKICEDIMIKNNGLILRVSKLVEGLDELISKWSVNLNNYKHINPFKNLNVSLFSINNLQKLIFYAIKNDKRGIIHLSATNEINYLKIGRILADFLNKPQSLVIPTKASKKKTKNWPHH